MLNVDVELNFDDIIDEIDDVFKRQIPYAGFLALNDTVFKTSMIARSTLMTPKYIQGGAVPFTKRGVRYKKAPNKHNLQAMVYIPDEQWKYLMWLVRGGDKRWLRSKHGIGVPIDIKLNKYGNIPGRKTKEKLWREILSRGSGQMAAPIKGSLGKKQFIGKSKKSGVVGLWQRTPPKGKGKPKLLVLFTKQAIPYKKNQLPFHRIVALNAGREFRKAFSKRLDQVIQREARRRV